MGQISSQIPPNKKFPLTKNNIFPWFYIPKGIQKTIAIGTYPIFAFFNSTYCATCVKTQPLVICSRRKWRNLYSQWWPRLSLTHCWSILSLCRLKDLSVFSCRGSSLDYTCPGGGATLQFLMTEFKREIRRNVSVSKWGVLWETLFDPEGRKF